MANTQYFLGANSADGFYSCYAELFGDPRISRLIILKGGPGCGKSTLMRALGREAETLGADTEEVLCSSDPASLDGLIIPQAGLALVDGTAPHVVEPPLCGCGAVYLDLGRHYDPVTLWAHRAELWEQKEKNAACYLPATACFRAAEALQEALPLQGSEKVCQLLGPKTVRADHRGKVLRRFYHALTPKGTMSLPLPCGRVRVLRGESGAASSLLRQTAEQYLQAGFDVILGLNPLRTEELAHLVIPGEDLGYAVENRLFPYPGPAAEFCEPDRPLTDGLSKAQAVRAEALLRLRDQALAEGLAHLEEAKQYHDRLEAAYRDGVDFAGVDGDVLTLKRLLRERLCARD